MGRQKMLHVEWTEQEAETNYVDKDHFSKAHDNGNSVTLKGYSGVYTFDKNTKSVSFNTGVEKREISVRKWKLFETPTPV